MSDRCVRLCSTVALGAPVKGLAVVRFGLVRASRGRRTPRALIVAATVPTTSSTTITTSTSTSTTTTTAATTTAITLLVRRLA